MLSLHILPAGHKLTVSIFDGSGFIRQHEDPTICQRITNAAAVSYGPYPFERKFVTQGAVTVTIAEADFAAVIRDIPAVDAEDSETVWNDAGTLKVSSAGA